MIIETERLVLRPWCPEDAESLYEYASSALVGPAAGWPVHESVENSREIIMSVLSAPETYALVDKGSGRAIGSIGLMVGPASHLKLGEKEAELGYWIGVPFWGRGLVPEAAERVICYAFDTLGMERLWCGYYDGNEKSRRVQEKCGFKYRFTKENVPCSMLKELRTEHISSLSREAWLAAKGV